MQIFGKNSKNTSGLLKYSEGTCDIGESVTNKRHSLRPKTNPIAENVPVPVLRIGIGLMSIQIRIRIRLYILMLMLIQIRIQLQVEHILKIIIFLLASKVCFH
jgi:hypothetical protein